MSAVETMATPLARPRAGLSPRFLRSELQIIFGRRRNLAGLGVLAVVPMILLLERKLLGRFQARYGPNRVGFRGLMQPLADVLKLLSKESYKPEAAAPVLWAVAPALVILSATATLAIIPFGLGLLGIVLRDDRRGWHDRIAHTDVLYEPEERRAAPWSKLEPQPDEGIEAPAAAAPAGTAARTWAGQRVEPSGPSTSL